MHCSSGCGSALLQGSALLTNACLMAGLPRGLCCTGTQSGCAPYSSAVTVFSSPLTGCGKAQEGTPQRAGALGEQVCRWESACCACQLAQGCTTSLLLSLSLCGWVALRSGMLLKHPLGAEALFHIPAGHMAVPRVLTGLPRAPAFGKVVEIHDP